MLATIWDWIQRLYRIVVNIIYAAVGIIVLLLLVRWGINWLIDRQWQAPFEAELVAAGYDSNIIGLTRYSVLEKIYLNDPSEPADPNIRAVPIHSDDAIIKLPDGERLVFISAALPHLFADVTRFAQTVNCVQAKARTRLENGSYTPYEEVFWLTYTHPVQRESQDAYEERIAKLDDKEQINREHLMHVMNSTSVNSNSALIQGTCVAELDGWIEEL